MIMIAMVTNNNWLV